MGKKIQKKVAPASEPLKKKIKRQNTMEVTAKEGKALISTLDKQNQKKKEEKKKNLVKATSVAVSKNGPKKVAKAIKEAKTVKEAKVVKATKTVKATKAVKERKAVKAEQKKPAAKPAKKDIKKPKAAPAKKISKVDKKIAPPPAASKAPKTKKAGTSSPKKPSTAAPTPSTLPDVLDKVFVAADTAVEKKETVPVVPVSSGYSFVFPANSYTTSVVQKDIDSCSSIASTQQVKNEKLGLQIIKRSLKGVAVAKPEDGEKKDKILRTKTGDKLAAGMVDIVFCCDTTSSMGTYLAQCKSTVNAIIKHILDKTQSEGISVKFGFVAYRDHPPQDKTYLTCSYDLTTEDEIKQFIESLSAYGGGDYPEAVMDGLYVSAKHMSWRDSTYIPSLRYIFHIADAPPHGSEYSTDFFKIICDKGCACEMDINKISHIINMKQIHYRFISTDNMKGTKKMAEIFKEKMVNYEECSITNAADMDIRISDMIIRELLPDMVEED